MINVIADLTIKPGQRQAFLNAFKQLVPEVHAEDGCIAYTPTIDTPAGLEVQPDLNNNLVTVIEQWESTDHLKAHLEATHMTEFFNSEFGQMIEKISVRVTEPA